MQQDVAKAQAENLRELADQWERDSIAAPAESEGYGEVAFRLRRAAEAIEAAVGLPKAAESAAAPVPAVKPEQALREG